MRALVIMPRSPTSTSRLSLNRVRTRSTMAMKAVGSAVLPLNTSTAIGRPCGSVSRPYSIWSLPTF